MPCRRPRRGRHLQARMKRSGRFLRNGALPDIAAGLSHDPTVEPSWSQEVVAWLDVPLDEFPAWACAHLECELASINELACTFRDNEEPAAITMKASGIRHEPHGARLDEQIFDNPLSIIRAGFLITRPAGHGFFPTAQAATAAPLAGFCNPPGSHRCHDKRRSPSAKCVHLAPPGSSSIAATMNAAIRSRCPQPYGPITCGCPTSKSVSLHGLRCPWRGC